MIKRIIRFFLIVIVFIIVFIILAFRLVINTVGVLSKDVIIDGYNNVIENLGEEALTSNWKLVGKREFEGSRYIGTYDAKYNKFYGKEYIFGGTTVKPDKNNKIRVKLEINNSSGNLKVIMKLKEKEEIIAEKDGTYGAEFELQAGSNYIIVEGERYSGDIKIEVK
ncbi:MAG: hypothetical protein HFJ46_06795 [Clostridia bacterium]|jgi:hypothetical protein|nr:hypothetical protein [Clostridia bacterium]